MNSCRTVSPVWTCFSIVLAALTFSLLGAGSAHAKSAAKKVDDLFLAVGDRRPDLSCYGHLLAKSQKIDRLAARGVLFDWADCQEAICSSSRASLMARLPPNSLGVAENVTYAPMKYWDLYDHADLKLKENIYLATSPEHPEPVRKLVAQQQALRSKTPANSNGQTDDVRPIDRRNTVLLDGTWEIIFDPENKGREAGWHDPDRFAESSRQTPDRGAELLGGNREGLRGRRLLRRDFNVPADWADQGRPAPVRRGELPGRGLAQRRRSASTRAASPPSSSASMIPQARQEHARLRVAGPILLTNKRIDGVGPMETPQWRGAITGGIWQSVRLVATGETYVDDVFIEPKIADNTADLRCRTRTQRR